MLEKLVQDLDADIAHADLIYIGKAHRKSDIHIFFILFNRVYLPADISFGVLDGKEYLVIKCQFIYLLSPL